MARKSNAATALQSSTRRETPFREFANSTLTPEQSKQRAAPLLNDGELLRNVLALTPEDQTKFIDKVDQVCRRWLVLLSEYLPSISAKAYPTIDPPDAKFVIALGEVCGATERLPTSALLSAGLEKRGNIAVASGGFTDIWRGEYYAMQVAIKAFRIYPAQNLKEAKEVSAYTQHRRSDYRRKFQILWKRVPIWRRLSHENILSFRGVTTTVFQLALVYDWGYNGNITQYTASNPRASRASLVWKSLVTVATTEDY